MKHHFFRREVDNAPVAAAGSRSRPTANERAGSDSATVTKVLNQALRIAELTVLSCKRQYHIALRLHSPPLAAAALEHANDAKLHANRVRERIVQLGGTPDPQPEAANRNRTHAQHDSLVTIISQHLIASRAAVESYAEIAAFFAPFDDETRKLLEDIAAGEQERGDDLARLQGDNARAAGAERQTPSIPS